MSNKIKRLNRRPKKPPIKILGVDYHGTLGPKEFRKHETDRRVRKRLKRFM